MVLLLRKFLHTVNVNRKRRKECGITSTKDRRQIYDSSLSRKYLTSFVLKRDTRKEDEIYHLEHRFFKNRSTFEHQHNLPKHTRCDNFIDSYSTFSFLFLHVRRLVFMHNVYTNVCQFEEDVCAHMFRDIMPDKWSLKAGETPGIWQKNIFVAICCFQRTNSFARAYLKENLTLLMKFKRICVIFRIYIKITFRKFSLLNKVKSEICFIQDLNFNVLRLSPFQDIIRVLQDVSKLFVTKRKCIRILI